MSNYKCKCGNTSDFFIEHNLSQCGMYCGCCGKWIKWVNKDEERLFKHKQNDAKIKTELLADLEQRLRFWDNKANAIPEYVWHCINAMKEQKNEIHI